MRIWFIPLEVSSGLYQRERNIIFLHREGEDPYPFMHEVDIDMDTESSQPSIERDIPKMSISGAFIGDHSIKELRDNDKLFITFPHFRYYSGKTFSPFYLEMYLAGDMLVSFPSQPTALGLAAGIGTHVEVFLTERGKCDLVEKAKQIAGKASALYAKYPMYSHIMLNSEDGIESVSIVELAARQDLSEHDGLIALFLAMTTSSVFDSINLNVVKRILEKCRFDGEFSMMTQEEQVGMFIEFSKKVTKRKKEYVTDEMIAMISGSPEYEQVKEKLGENGLGISRTQQFNVFQQVGFFSKDRKQNILYNLSDMGAGKTLMTVEAVYLMDLKLLSMYRGMKEDIEELDVRKVFHPDKHIIAPTLSVKSSWIDTFRLFYDVEEVDENTYRLTASFGGVEAESMIYVSSFTVKDGKIFVKEKLPAAKNGTYLIIDEIHQLVNRNISKTKFFPPKTIPINIYRIFILSGTMSNMKAMQWYNYQRFMGLPLSDSNANEASNKAGELRQDFKTAIKEASKNLKMEQHRYFDTDMVSEANYHNHINPKPQTAYEREFFAKYGAQLVRMPKGEHQVEDVLANSGNFNLENDPMEMDAINFELFYKLVGSRAVTAQSMQVAEELFGEQKTQHKSDIIKTVSPLSKSDIQILKVLHHIAEDHNCYKSATIAKAINNAILNLNDGLQTKNIYEIVSGFAEKNLRFFEYLSTLEETDKFKILKDILRREKDETHLIVVNDYHALVSLSEALGIEHLTKEQLKRELDYQDVLDGLFAKQSIVIVTQDMIKSSLDLVQANRLIQYQLNTEISDIIQTQNRINRIGQKRETRGYYIASDQLQENLIELFLESYRNIRVAHKGIVELFTDITSQINVVNDYLERAFAAIDGVSAEEPEIVEEAAPLEEAGTDLSVRNALPEGVQLASEGSQSRAVLFPQNGIVLVLLPLSTGTAFPYGQLKTEKATQMGVDAPMQIIWDLETDCIVEDVSQA